MEMLNVALDYLGRGFSVIPVERETKEPVVRWAAYQYRPPSARTVRAWWDANEDYNPGIVTAAGASEEVRRLVIFDFDNGDRYANERGRLPDKTWVASTGRSR
ncbi:MAG: bifunctional DNA primase/polymerase, partial [Leptospirales bacterium]